MQSFFGTKRVILGRFQAPHSTAVRTNHCPDGSKSIEVIAGGDGGYGEPPDHIRDGYLTLLVNEVQHTPASLFC